MHIEELRLREACFRGDLKYIRHSRTLTLSLPRSVNRLVNPDEVGCASNPIGRLLLKHMLIQQVRI